MTRETPYVNGLPVPGWLDCFAQDPDGHWRFYAPSGACIYIDPADFAHAPEVAERLLQAWRTVIAAVAERAWRVRAERMFNVAVRLNSYYCIEDNPYRKSKALGKWKQMAGEHKVLCHAVAACREWGRGE